MIYTPMTKKALQLCFQAHKDQADKAGLPYVFHPFHLAEQMETEETVTAALLHDVAEDSNYTLKDLKRLGFPPPVLHALTLLTHSPGEPYLEYICRVACNPIAAAVKQADLRHNSDLTRLEEITDRDRARAGKYLLALRLLEDFHYDPELGWGRSSVPVCEEQSVFLTMAASEAEMLGYRLDGEKDGVRIGLAPAEARKLRELLPPAASFPGRLARYLEEHKFLELFDFLDENGVACAKHILV